MNFDSEIADAKEAIYEVGSDVTWRKVANTDNALQPWKSDAQVPTDNAIKLLFLSAGSGLFSSLLRLLKDTDVPTGAGRALMAVESFKPEITDVVVKADGTVLNIAAIDPVPNAETPILYKVRFA